MPSSAEFHPVTKDDIRFRIHLVFLLRVSRRNHEAHDLPGERDFEPLRGRRESRNQVGTKCARCPTSRARKWQDPSPTLRDELPRLRERLAPRIRAELLLSSSIL